MALDMNNVVPNIITPLIQAIVYVSLVLGVFYIFYLVIRNIIPDFNFWVKYSIFRRKFDEEAVKWCMDALEKGMSIEEAEKFLLLKKIKPKKVREIKYIFNKVEKKLLKGGDYKDEQSRQSDGQNKIPEIKPKHS